MNRLAKALIQFIAAMSQSIEALQRHLYQQTDLLDQLPIAISFKDTQLRYRYFNAQALQNAGFTHSADVFEKTDVDMPWHDQAAIFQQGGRKVLAGATLVTLDPITTQDQRDLTYLTQQKPVRDPQGAIVGISLTTRIIAQHKLIKCSRYVTEQDRRQLAEILQPHLPDMAQPARRLSEHEQITLYYLLQGMTLSQIAIKLSRSTHTIKDRVTRLKAIFNCSSKTMLIHQATAEGYRHSLPKALRLSC